MKTKTVLKIICTLLTLSFGSAKAIADNAPSEINFSGNNLVSIEFAGTSSSTLEWCLATFWGFGGECWNIGKDSITQATYVESSLAVKTLTDRKVLIVYSMSGAHGCNGIQKTYIGYKTLHGTYNMYESFAPQPDVDPSASHSAATLLITGAGAQIQLLDNMHALTAQDNGATCSWDISTGAELQFSLSNDSSEHSDN